MISLVSKIILLLLNDINNLLDTDFSLVKYRRDELAFVIGLILAILLFVKLISRFFLNKKDSRGYPGYKIPRRNKRGFIVKVIGVMPKAVIIVGVLLILVGFRDPYLVDSREVVNNTEYQVRIDLVDVSSSMDENFPGTDKEKHEIAREELLKFIEMRKDKNDIVSLWLFASNPYTMVDFTRDYNQYFLHVYGAPHIFMYSKSTSMSEEDFAKKLAHKNAALIPGEGGTDIKKALGAIIEDWDNNPFIQEFTGNDVKKTLLITTDAEVTKFPENELRQLKERNIVPIILFINDGGGSYGGEYRPSALSYELPELVRKIESYGGKYFDVKDEESLQRAYEEINKSDKINLREIQRVGEVDIYQRFLTAGIALMCFGMVAGFLFELFWGIYP